MTMPARPRALVGLAIAGQAIATVLAIILARALDVAGFEAYVVASALFILLATAAPLGAEKHALKALPQLMDRQDWPQARALLRFGGRRTLFAALLAATGCAIWAAWATTGPVRAAILVTCLSLPAGALVHYALEALTALGRPQRALAIFRVGVPATALGLALGVLVSPVPLSGAIAVACWGLAWLVALALMWRSLRQAAPDALRAAEPRRGADDWSREAVPFFVYRLSVSLLAQAAILVLDRLAPAPGQVGAYAVSLSIVSMAAVLATATNRAYSRELALLLERRDYAGLMQARRARLRWLLPVVAGFLLLVMLFPREILSLFRPEFAGPGEAPLRILALSTAFTVLLALAPTYMKFRRRNRLTYAIVGSAAALQLVLLLLLVPRYGATGAALSQMGSMLMMYGSFALFGHRELRALKAG